MTNRERCLNLLRFQPVDRLPAVHFGYWRELLDEWAAQGKIPKGVLENGWWDGGPADRELDRLIGWDGNWASTWGCRNGLYPAFERKVLETLPDGTQRVQNGDGLIERIHPGVVSIPEEDDYLLKDRKAFEELYLPKLQFTPDRVDLEFYRRFNEDVYSKLDVPVGISLGSVLGTVRNWCSVVGMSYLMYDEDETLFQDIVDALADLQYKCVEVILSTGAKFDFGHYWEDICFNSGSLVNPELFRELCGEHYWRRNDLCRRHGIDLVSLDCDGVTRQLTPIWFENGVNIMFPIEVGTWGDQFLPMREQLGKGLLGIGGMDKTTLRADKAAVDKEIERMRRLAGEGGFIPCPDHRLMPGTKFELVQYYAEEIKKIVP